MFVEEGILNGGFSMIVSNAIRLKHTHLSGISIGISAIDDNFATPEEPCDLYDYVGLSPAKLVEKIKSL